uniref:non-specific serine/threonine protein kinase n=1 Tax=Cyprinus carpio TaxID=7962 RepID=A0A8C2Q6X7_CYPCA
MLDNTENNNYTVHSNEQQESQHPISIVPPESAGKSTLKIKKKVIREEYKLAGQVLGIGINCKVWEIFQKKCGENYMLQDTPKARWEVELHCRASSCPCIVGIEDVFENCYQGKKCLLLIMELWIRQRDHVTTAYTPYYVAKQTSPEKYKSCDMWSLGVIINIMLLHFPSEQILCILLGCVDTQTTYEFPHPEWSQVSEEGHFMVCNTSNGTFCSNKSVNVPPTHLHTSRVLKEESHVWDKVKEEMTNALATIRVDYEQIKIKPIKDSSNPLLLKRRKKTAAVMKEAPGCS